MTMIMLQRLGEALGAGSEWSHGEEGMVDSFGKSSVAYSS